MANLTMLTTDITDYIISFTDIINEYDVQSHYNSAWLS